MTQKLEEEEVLTNVQEHLQEAMYPDRSEAFRECVRVRMEEGMTRGEAEAHCEAATLPSDEPTPPPGSTGTDVKVKPEKDQTPEEVEKTPMERCIAEQMDIGKSEEEAKAWCEAELEGKSKEDAEKFVKDVEAGQYIPTHILIARKEKLLKMKAQRDIERQRQARRFPV